MGWNGSNSGSGTVGGDVSAPRKVGGDHRAPRLAKGIIAGLVVVIGAGVVFWYIGSKDTSKPTKEKKAAAKQIVEVTPQIVTQAVEVAETPKKVEKPKNFWEVDASQTNGFNAAQVAKWKAAHRPPPGYINNSSLTEPPARYAIFHHRSENEIAALLTMEPGETLVGTPDYRGMTADFMKSCEEPIVATADDDEYTRDLKKQMNAVKIELRQRMANGEKLEDILTETREEYQQLSRYRNMLNDELRDYLNNPDNTDQDIEDFVTAANKMLDEKGVAPLKLGLITRRRLEMMKEQRELKGEYK